MGVIKYTKEFIKNFVEENNYEFIGFDEDGYRGIESKIIVWCKNINHKPYKVSFGNFKGRGKNKGTRCKQCYDENRFWSNEKIINFIEDKNYKVLEILDGYGQNTKVKIWCGNENHKPYIVTFANFKGRSNRNGTRCPECSLKKSSLSKTKWTEDAIREYVENKGYVFIKIIEYKYNKSKILIWCGNDDHAYWETRFDSFYYDKYRCPQCNETKGEKSISDVLNKYNINFKSQYKFNNCKSKRELPFDFYIPNLNIVIEYDGIQHYEIIKYFSGLDGFITTKIHDVIKTKYCEDNNIKLIRIPYWEYDNIENILIKELNLK